MPHHQADQQFLSHSPALSIARHKSAFADFVLLLTLAPARGHAPHRESGLGYVVAPEAERLRRRQ